MIFAHTKNYSKFGRNFDHVADDDVQIDLQFCANLAMLMLYMPNNDFTLKLQMKIKLCAEISGMLLYK